MAGNLKHTYFLQTVKILLFCLTVSETPQIKGNTISQPHTFSNSQNKMKYESFDFDFFLFHLYFDIWDFSGYTWIRSCYISHH